jgi:glutamate/tyrosine decarboxylase-like PLP-dependent enzyme
LRWLLEALSLPSECGGAFVTGATMANFTALAAARHAVLGHMGWDVEAQGLFGAPAIPVAAGQEAHPSVIKALGMLGMGRERVVRVPVDRQRRMLAAELPELKPPSIVCVQVGNVNTGSFDPVAEICLRAHEARPRRGHPGRAEIAGTQRPRRVDRAQLPLCHALRGRIGECEL